MSQTIQKQLADIGPTFEVDGVEWRRYNYQLEPLGLRTEISGTKISVQWVNLYNGWELVHKYFSLYEFLKFSDCPTPADACRKALLLCRERVAELVKGLGMGDTFTVIKGDEVNSFLSSALRLLDTAQLSTLTVALAERAGMVVNSASTVIGWSAGAAIRITSCLYGHEFQIGETAIILSRSDDSETWLCTNNKGSRWYVKEDEGELIT